MKSHIKTAKMKLPLHKFSFVKATAPLHQIVNSIHPTYHLSILSTQLSSIFHGRPVSAIFLNAKKSGSQNRCPNDPNSQKSLVFCTFPLSYFSTLDINTTRKDRKYAKCPSWYVKNISTTILPFRRYAKIYQPFVANL